MALMRLAEPLSGLVKLNLSFIKWAGLTQWAQEWLSHPYNQPPLVLQTSWLVGSNPSDTSSLTYTSLLLRPLPLPVPDFIQEAPEGVFIPGTKHRILGGPWYSRTRRYHGIYCSGIVVLPSWRPRVCLWANLHLTESSTGLVGVSR